MSREFLTPKQVAERYGAKVTALSNWRFHKKGPPYTKVGGKVLYPLDELIEWEKKQTIKPTE